MKIIRWLHKYWFQVSFLEVAFDLDDSIYLDLVNISAGTENGLRFNGSLLCLYWEPGYSYMNRLPHFTWDFCYIRQWWDHG